MVSRNNELIAFDTFTGTYSSPKTRKVADLYYKKHILGTYDDENKITTPYKGYFPEYSPTPGVMIRVINKDIGFGPNSKVLVAPTGSPSFKPVWVPKGKRVTEVINERW
jgi:hypothetical protein